MRLPKHLYLSICLICITLGSMAQTPQIIHLWPGQVPGQKKPKKEAVKSSDTTDNVIRLSEVTDPLMEVYLAPPGTPKTNAAILICPGGGYNVLAINLEGREIASWLNTLGISAYVLQYRVPQNRSAALQDAQRAIRLIRANARSNDINLEKIGVMGFSAGGHLAARLSTAYDENLYNAFDPSDLVSARPDFTILIYPAYLDEGPEKTLSEDLKLNPKTPPFFLFQTSDDGYENSSWIMAKAMHEQKLRVDFHSFPNGGHGYGMRHENPAAREWPKLLEEWLTRTINIAR